jgi:hypothetical protein
VVAEVACYAPWRTALYEAILQDQRSKKNKAPVDAGLSPLIS